MEPELLEKLPAENRALAALLSVEQVERVLANVQHAYKSELQPGMANAFPNSAPPEYVEAHFCEHLMKMYTDARTKCTINSRVQAGIFNFLLVLGDT